MLSFPPDLVVEILSRLPPEDLIRCMCVCKAWNALIRDKNLIKSHLQRSIQTNFTRTIVLHSSDLVSFYLPFCDNETFGSPVKIVHPLKDPWTLILSSSVNGLFCIRNKANGDFSLWNQSIRKLKKIPPTTLQPRPSSDSRCVPVYGFGYDSANDDCKLVGIIEYYNKVEKIMVNPDVQMYSLKSNSWKRIQNWPCGGFRLYRTHPPRRLLFMNGALFWLIHNKIDKNSVIILTLDLASEKYCQFPTPVDGSDNIFLSLEVLGGCFCLRVNHVTAGHDIWILKEYGVTESWTLLFSIEREAVHAQNKFLCRPLVISKNGEMVLLTNDDGVIYWYDLEKKSVKRVEIRGGPRTFAATLCVGSLCLLDGVVERKQHVGSLPLRRGSIQEDFRFRDLIVSETEDDQN